MLGTTKNRPRGRVYLWTASLFGILIFIHGLRFDGIILLPSSSVNHRDNEKSVQNIPVNPNSTMTNSVLAIQHYPDASAIRVLIQSNTTNCTHPYLKARLSGPALTMVVGWTTISHSTTNNTQDKNNDVTILQGHYHAPVAGLYYLEVIVVFCKDIRTIPIWENNYNFRSSCVEDPHRHRLTVRNASIQVTSHDRNERSYPGHWMANNNNNNSSLEDNTSKAIYTRFQPLGCRKTNGKYASHCFGSETNLNRFQDYSFQFNSHVFNSMPNSQNNNKKIKICLIGVSHSLRLFWAWERLTKPSNNNNNKANNNNNSILPTILQHVDIHFDDGIFRYPADVTVDRVEHLVQTYNCSTLLIGLGQWPASRRPTLFDEYYQEIKLMLQDILLQREGIMNIVLRSINYNPLGDWIGSMCPPRDWRNPMVIDGYNTILQRISNEYNHRVQYVDTNSIVGPVWDSAPDWCHLDEATSDAQLLYILSEILRRSID